jgi:hypothetical protein
MGAVVGMRDAGWRRFTGTVVPVITDAGAHH